MEMPAELQMEAQTIPPAIPAEPQAAQMNQTAAVQVKQMEIPEAEMEKIQQQETIVNPLTVKRIQVAVLRAAQPVKTAPIRVTFLKLQPQL